jgi:hypothetical protein
MQREVIKANIVVFIASFCTLVIELVAGRIMAPYVGVSLYTWTSEPIWEAGLPIDIPVPPPSVGSSFFLA